MTNLKTKSGLNLRFEEKGEGPPLVLVHGWATSSAVWRFQEELADAFRLITYDLRGHGKSEPAPTSLALADLAGDMVDLFTALDLRKATLLGWSLGAQVALAAFSSLRDRVAGLVLVGGTPRFTASDDFSHGLPVNDLRGMALGLKRDYQQKMGSFFRNMFVPGELSRAQESRIARDIVMAGRLPEPAVALATLDILASTDLRGMLSTVDRPVLLIHGNADTICLPGASRFMAGRLPHPRLVLLDDVGHAPFLSRPEEFNLIVREFAEYIYGAD